MFRILGTLFLAGLVLAAGCSKKDGEPAPAPPAPAGEVSTLPTATAVFEGRDGFEVVTAFREDGAWLFLPGETVQLPRVPAASGEKYSNGAITLWTSGDEATLTLPGRGEFQVLNNRRRAVWEHAKLSGMDFRAVGNEPGWVLEIWGDGPIVFRGDYGQTLHQFPKPRPIEDQEARTSTWTCRNDEGREMIVILSVAEGGCADTMSGDRFETTVLIRLDGREYRGCGHALH